MTYPLKMIHIHRLGVTRIVNLPCGLLNLFFFELVLWLSDESGTSNSSEKDLFVHLQHSSWSQGPQNDINSIMAACNQSGVMAPCCM